MNTHSVNCFQKYGTLSFSYYQLPTLSVSVQYLLSVAQNKPDSGQFSSDCIHVDQFCGHQFESNIHYKLLYENLTVKRPY